MYCADSERGLKKPGCILWVAVKLCQQTKAQLRSYYQVYAAHRQPFCVLLETKERYCAAQLWDLTVLYRYSQELPQKVTTCWQLSINGLVLINVTDVSMFLASSSTRSSRCWCSCVYCDQWWAPWVGGVLRVNACRGNKLNIQRVCRCKSKCS